jgi:hypothetical protein
MMISRFTYWAVVAALFVSCSRNNGTDSNGVKDTTPPIITIVSPIDNQQFTAGQTIQITANAIDNLKVTELHIHVSNAVTGVLLRDIHSYPGTMTATVQDSFTAQNGISYLIKLIGYDPSHNLATAQISISVQ